MTDARPPKIDRRNALQVAAQTELLARRLVRDDDGHAWDPPPGTTDPGRTLITLFSHLMEQVIGRLNRVPDKQRRLFLQLAGLDPLPPLPSRVPVTFTASPRATPTVPRGTVLTADPADGDPDPLQYETDDELTVHPVELLALHGTCAPAPAPAPAELAGDRWLYLTHPLFDLAAGTHPTTFTTTPETLFKGLQFWDGKQWHDLPDGGPHLTLAALATSTIAGRTARWLRHPAPVTPPRALAFHVAAPVNVPPDAATVNRAPVDPTATIRPFGLAPAPGDALYIRSDRAFRRDAVTLNVTGVFAGAAEPPTVQWQYWDGAAWQPALQDDGTANFTRDGTIVLSNLAPHPSPDGGWWLRALLTVGAFGVTKEIVTTTTPEGGKPIHTRVTLDLPPAPDQVPRFTGLTIALRDHDIPTPADLVLQEGPRLTAITPTPSSPDDPEPALLLALSRPFDNRPVALFFEILSPDDRERTSPTWSYSTASGWKPLALVADDTGGLSRSGLVRFVGPSDMAVRTAAGRRAAWLRVDGLPADLRLGLVRLNTVWATQAVTIADERLGASTGRPDRRFRTARVPVLDGERLVVAGEPWTRVADLRVCGPDDRCYQLDRTTGDITFGDGVHGQIPVKHPDGLRIRYRTGGGTRGDRPAGAVKALERELPGVTGVRNDLPAAGGRDAESPDHLAARTARWLRHRDRAVAVQDYVDLALEASPHVGRAWVVPLRFNVADADGPPPEGANEVRIVIATRDRRTDYTPDRGLLSAVESYLAERAPAGVTIDCLPPAVDKSWQLRATIAGDGDIVPAATSALAAFLDPIAGGPDGLGFTLGPSIAADLLGVLARVPGLTSVRSLAVEQVGAPPGDASAATALHIVTIALTQDP